MSAEGIEPRQLGGWLILVGLGVVLNPIIMGFSVYTTYVPLFSTGIMTELMDPSSPSYNGLLVPYIGAEIAINLLLICGWIVAGYLFFMRRVAFPKLYIFLMVTNVVFLALDSAVGSYVLNLPLFGEGGMFDEATVRAIVRTILSCCIWVPYMLMSQRVKETFLFLKDGRIAGDDRLQQVFD